MMLMKRQNAIFVWEMMTMKVMRWYSVMAVTLLHIRLVMGEMWLRIFLVKMSYGSAKDVGL